MKLASKILCLVLCVLSSQSLANVIIHLQNGSSIDLISVAQQYGKNRRDFATVSASFGGMPLESGPPYRENMILALEYRGWKYPYVETVLTDYKKQYKPAAVIYFHRNNSDYWGYGFPEFITSGADASEIDFPVVNMNSPEWDILEAQFRNSPDSPLNLTVTSAGYGMWQAQKLSGIWIFFSVLALPFAAINFVLAIIALVRQPGRFKPSVAVLCLILEIFAHLIRFLFALDPGGPWKLYPYPIEQVLLSISFPASIMSMLLLTLHWQELIDFSSFKVSSLLSRSRIPAIIVAILTSVFEPASAAIRAADISYQVIALINGVIYVLCLSIYILHATYVSVRVFRFLKNTRKLNNIQRVLRRFTMRSSISIAGALVMLSAGIAVFWSGANIYANFYAIFCSHMGLNFVGLFQILAFLHATRDRRSESRGSSRQSGLSSSNYDKVGSTSLSLSSAKV